MAHPIARLFTGVAFGLMAFKTAKHRCASVLELPFQAYQIPHSGLHP
ncbi:hypothetical protein [Deinococcus misasensis]|nr:hypothetical protein [Deinococcus misasensis]